MKLSIIIPAYNAEKYIEECISSCIHQDVEEGMYEMIIIDDGSTDSTLSIAKKLASGHESIKVIHQDNMGLSMARNRGIESAKGDYLMFVDSDDTIIENTTANLVEKCIQDDLDILQFCAADDMEGNLKRRMSYAEAGKISKGKSLLMRKIQVCAPFALYRRKFLVENSLSFYPGIYHEDDEFKTRAMYMAERVGAINDIIYIVRQSPGSITRSIHPKKSYDSLTVIESLAAFAEKQPNDKYKKGIYLQIAHTFNWCLHEMTSLPEREAEKLESYISARKHLFSHICKSPSILHKTEGLLMRIFPNSILSIYRFLNMIHPGRKRR